MNLVQALDAERRRISEDLHDHAGPDLAAAALHLRAIDARLVSALPAPDAAEVRRLLAEVQSLLAAAITQIRDLSADLRPARLQYAGLLPTLDDLLRKYQARTGRAARLDAPLDTGGRPARRLAPAIEWLIFRVVQEALTNCARHAAAHEVVVALRRADDDLQLDIRDDGVGFDPAVVGTAPQAPGLGLLTMQERVVLAGGRYALTSSPGAGTRIEVHLPLAPRRAARGAGTPPA